MLTIDVSGGKGYMGVFHTILATFPQFWNYIKTMLLKVEGKRQNDPSRQIRELEEKIYWKIQE